jgi:hypothetical protein
MLANSGESGPPCGVPFPAGRFASVALPPRRSLDVPDQPQQAFITHFATYQVYQSVVVHVIEEALQLDAPPSFCPRARGFAPPAPRPARSVSDSNRSCVY